MATSPVPIIFTLPVSFTVATASLLELYFTHRVTSSIFPLLYFARTVSCCSAPGCSTALAGVTSSETTSGSAAIGGGAPPAIQS